MLAVWLQCSKDTVLVAGATGGVGQLLCAKLLEVCTANHAVRRLLMPILACAKRYIMPYTAERLFSACPRTRCRQSNNHARLKRRTAGEH